MRSGLRSARIGFVNDGPMRIRRASRRLRASCAAAGSDGRSVPKSLLSDGCTWVSVRIAMSALKRQVLHKKELDHAKPVPSGIPAVPLPGANVDAQGLGLALNLDFRVLLLLRPMRSHQR
jgi:hypothetical protein